MDTSYELIITDDGSHSVRVPEHNVTFHSTHGALTESRHIFINHGLMPSLAVNLGDRMEILEFGFGTGLNAALTWHEADRLCRPIQYCAIEQTPLPISIVRQLNYPKLIPMPSSNFLRLHERSADPKLSDYFIIDHISSTDCIEGISYDLIYYDAFGPGYQPHLWDKDQVKRLFSLMKSGGRLVTFCAQGAFKRHLQSVGLQVHALPGPPGKREMTLATKP